MRLGKKFSLIINLAFTYSETSTKIHIHENFLRPAIHN